MTVRPLVVMLALAVVTSGNALADAQPANLFDAAFSSSVSPQINKVVVVRINPWIDRVIAPTPGTFDKGLSKGDSQAVFTDRAEIEGITGALRRTSVIKEGDCYNTTYTTSRFPVSWAVFFHDDESNVVGKENDTVVGSVYVSPNALCVFTRDRIYNVGLDGIEPYLKRTFSFMNFEAAPKPRRRPWRHCGRERLAARKPRLAAASQSWLSLAP